MDREEGQRKDSRAETTARQAEADQTSKGQRMSTEAPGPGGGAREHKEGHRSGRQHITPAGQQPGDGSGSGTQKEGQYGRIEKAQGERRGAGPRPELDLEDLASARQ